MKQAFFIWICVLTWILLFSPARAEQSLHIDIFGPGQDRINIFLPHPLPLYSNEFENKEHAHRIHSMFYKNFGLLPFLNRIPEDHILGGPKIKGVKGADIDFRKFHMSKVDLLVTLGIDQTQGLPGSVEIRAFEVFSRKMVLGKAYTLHEPDQIPMMVRKFCAELMELITGNGDFFRSQLAFERKTGQHKEIWTVTPLGYNLSPVTDLQAIALSPAWSRDSSRLAFTLLQDNTHSLGVWDRDEDRIQIIDLPGNVIISPTFAPSGRLGVSIDPKGRPDIYWLDENLNLDRPIMEHWSIDVSPSFDAKERKMAFASGRLGNPHIFVLDLKTRQVQRVTHEGKYNTNPTISPDGKYVAFNRQTPEGHRIFLTELETGREKQISFGPGNDEDPTFAPDGYFIAFSSSRSEEYQLYITTRNADEPIRIPTGRGRATSPAWGVAEDF